VKWISQVIQDPWKNDDVKRAELFGCQIVDVHFMHLHFRIEIRHEELNEGLGKFVVDSNDIGAAQFLCLERKQTVSTSDI